MIKKKLLPLCLIVLCVFFMGCGYKGYSGEHHDLYTVAINSLLWNNGHSYDAERVTDSQIEILEKDNYGRILYTYQEAYYSGAKMTFSALLISQCSLNGFVYYYEDFNFIIKQQELYSAEISCFSFEDITYLKSLNDWDKDIDFEKCVKKEISNVKNNIPFNNETITQKVINEFKLTDSEYNLFLDYLTDDIRDNFLFYGSIMKFNENDIYFVGLIDSDYNDIKFLVPSNLYSYQEELIKFKRDNGWEMSDNS